jgi:hypothetical protein
MSNALCAALAQLDEQPDVGVLLSAPFERLLADYNGTLSREAKEDLLGIDQDGILDPVVAMCPPLLDTLSGIVVRRSVLDAAGRCDEALAAFAAPDLWRRLLQAGRVCVSRVPLLGPTSISRPDAGIRCVLQDPITTLGAYSYYAEKLQEDRANLPASTRGASLRRLGEQAAAELLRDPIHRSWGEILSREARRRFQPRVSVIIPVYNGADYLAEAIDSALAQTYENVEIVVINDGSTDDGATERVARGYGDRIRYFSQPNGGVASALNRGIEVMTGDYFSWLSHDDLYVPEKLAVQISALGHVPNPSRVVFYSDFDVFTTDPTSAEPFVLEDIAPRDFRYYLTVANALHGCTLLVPREAFAEHGRFDTTLRTTQDYDLWFRMAESFAFVHQPRVLVHARSHPNQGTLALSHLVERESNALLGGFVERLSMGEVQRSGDESVADGYLRLAENLDMRGFRDASARAVERWAAQQPEATQEDYRKQLVTLARKALRVRTESEQIARQRDAASREAEALREELAAIYRSRSWAFVTRLQETYTRVRWWRR